MIDYKGPRLGFVHRFASLCNAPFWSEACSQWPRLPKCWGSDRSAPKLRNRLVKLRRHVLPASWHCRRVSFQALSRTDEQDGFPVFLLFSTFWSHDCLHCLRVRISNGQIAVDLFEAVDIYKTTGAVALKKSWFHALKPKANARCVALREKIWDI